MVVEKGGAFRSRFSFRVCSDVNFADFVILNHSVMESNKDEAMRCIDISVAALASGDMQRARKFIRIARRLDPNVSVDGFLAACEKLGSSESPPPQGKSAAGRFHEEPTCSNSSEPFNGNMSYTKEHAELIREVNSLKDYYAILGVEKGCSVEDIRRAYKKLSLRVHPDKNKAPGAEEAFKIVSKAFKCLSNEDSRRQYDEVGLVEEFELNHQCQARRRRRRPARYDSFEEDFDPDEIFRSFFFGSQGNAYHVRRANRPRSHATQQGENNTHGEGVPNFITLLQFLPILIFLMLIFYPFSETHYSLQKTHAYQVPMITEINGIEYFVKSSDFDHQFPQGSAARSKVENDVLRGYKSILSRYCNMELQRRHWVRDYPTPHCDRLRSLL